VLADEDSRQVVPHILWASAVFIIAPMVHTHLYLVPEGNVPKSSVLSEAWKHWIEQHFHVA